MLPGKMVLVTGGTGFVGSRLIEKLVLDYRCRVRVLVRDFTRVARIACLPVEMARGDITDRSSVERSIRGCDIVFHCAYDFGSGRAGQQQVGIQGSRYVAEAVLSQNVSRMVHVSTFSVYGPTADSDLTESSPWSPATNAYCQVKREAEHLLCDLRKRQSLPAVVVQPTLVYGPFSQHWTIDPVNKLKTGLVPLVEGGQGYCNAVYIDDLVDAMILAASREGVLGETFLISGEEPVTWRTFYHALEQAVGVKATVDMPVQQLEAMMREQVGRRGTIPMLLTWARDPQVFASVAALPAVQASLQALRRCLSDRQWKSLKTWVLGNGAVGKGRKEGRGVHLPDASLLALYKSRTRVCIDKARQFLGYTPKFTFERGMGLTALFIYWAGLAPVPASGQQGAGQPSGMVSRNVHVAPAATLGERDVCPPTSA